VSIKINPFTLILMYLSGADPSILKRIPKDDRQSYFWIGFYNLSTAILFSTIIIYVLTTYQLISFDSDINALALTISSLLLLAIQIMITGKMINDWSPISQLFYFFWGGILLFFLVSFMKYQFSSSLILGSIKGISYITLALVAFLQYILCYLGIRQVRNDFYHRLLNERLKLNKDLLEKQRQRIIEDFQVQNEITQTKTALTELSKSGDANKNEIHKILDGLRDDKSPTALMTLAEIESKNGNFQKALDYINKAIETGTSAGSQSQDAQLYEVKARILKAAGLLEDAEVTERIAIRLKNENAFLANKGKRILLNNITLENVSIFDNFTWQFTPGINILLGKNGYGKSHLLGLLIAALYDDKTKIREWISTADTSSNVKLNLSGEVPGHEKEPELAKKLKEIAKLQEDLEKEVVKHRETSTNEDQSGEISDIFSSQIRQLNDLNQQIITLQNEINSFQPTIQADVNTIKSRTGRIPLLAIPDSRFINKSENAIDNVISEHDDLAQYGGHEFLYSLPYARVIKNSLFEASLDHLESGRKFDIEPFSLIQNIIKELSSDKLIMVDDQVVYQDESKFKFVSIDRSSKEGTFQIIVKPEDADLSLPLQKISQGTFSVIAICCVIHNFLKAIYGNDKDKFTKPAIIIIDELDAHIHPSWQRKLIGILRKYFPGVQFIISAHSPLLITGCRANEVSVLRRTNKGKFRIQTISRSIFGSTIEDLHSLIFEIESSDADVLRYKEVAVYKAKYHQELDELLRIGEGEESLTTAQLSRINELQDLITHIEIAEKSYARDKVQKETGMTQIMEYQQKAIETQNNDQEKSKATGMQTSTTTNS
jgi:predicted ATP-binding protein involved in virulence